MIEQLKTIREALETANLGLEDGVATHKALTALAQLEAMAGAQEPWPTFQDDAAVDSFLTPARIITLSAKHPAALVRGLARRAASLTAAPVAQQYEAGDVASAAAQGFRDGVASVAQQPQAETDESIAADAYGVACDEMERWQHERRKAGKNAGTTGSLVDGIAWLYGYINDLEAKQPQAEAVPPGYVLVAVDALTRWRAAFSEEMSAWDTDPPDHIRQGWREIDALIDPHSIDPDIDAQPPQAEAVPADQSKWCAYVAGVIGCYLGEVDDSAKVKAIAGIIERRVWALAPQQAEAVPPDVVQDAVAAEREACARQCEDIYSWRGAYSAGPMCTPTLEAAAAAIRARGHAAIAQQKGQQP